MIHFQDRLPVYSCPNQLTSDYYVPFVFMSFPFCFCLTKKIVKVRMEEFFLTVSIHSDP